jgi:heme a synthase
MSQGTFRRIALLAVVAFALIIVTGGAVRLTDSGLGCPDWPTCAGHHLVARWQYHQVVEFANRVFTVAVAVAAVAAMVASLMTRPRRKDLVVGSLGLVAAVVAQIVLGGLTVLFELAPPFVMAHFLLSIAALWVALVLYDRARSPVGPARPVVSRGTVVLGRLIGLFVVVVLVLGTVVTGSGPHSGSDHTSRLAFAYRDATELHATAVMFVIGFTLAALFAIHQGNAPPAVLKRARVLLEIMVAQAALGYAQYFTHVPALLVGIHLAGATVVWIATVQLNLSFHRRSAPSPALALSETERGAPLLVAS